MKRSLECTVCEEAFERLVPDEPSPYRDAVVSMPAVCEGCIAGGDDEARDVHEEHIRTARERRFEQRRLACGVPRSLAELPLEQLDPGARADAISAAQEWAKGERQGLVFAGSVGVGKTLMAGGATLERLALEPLRWLSTPQLLLKLRADFGTAEQAEIVELLTGRVGLVLDDLDKVRPTEYAAEHLYAAIDSRVAEGAPLLVTTNLTLGGIADRFPGSFGESIASRLAGYCEVFWLEGADRRLKHRRTA